MLHLEESRPGHPYPEAVGHPHAGKITDICQVMKVLLINLLEPQLGLTLNEIRGPPRLCGVFSQSEGKRLIHSIQLNIQMHRDSRGKENYTRGKQMVQLVEANPPELN